MPLHESVQAFHEALAIIDSAIRMSPPYDFAADRGKIIARFETAYRALKKSALQQIDGGSLREDVQCMLADCVNNYRSYSRQISDARSPSQVAQRKKESRTLRRQAVIDAYALAEVASHWQYNAQRRAR
jgi:hypothetical protein